MRAGVTRGGIAKLSAVYFPGDLVPYGSRSRGSAETAEKVGYGFGISECPKYCLNPCTRKGREEVS